MKGISSRFEVLPVDENRLTEAVRPSLRFNSKLGKTFQTFEGSCSLSILS